MNSILPAAQYVRTARLCDDASIDQNLKRTVANSLSKC